MSLFVAPHRIALPVFVVCVFMCSKQKTDVLCESLPFHVCVLNFYFWPARLAHVKSKGCDALYTYHRSNTHTIIKPHHTPSHKKLNLQSDKLV